MDDYKKYDELKEKVDKFKLTELGIDSSKRNDFYAHYNDLQAIREIEIRNNGVLSAEEQQQKEDYMRAIDHWVKSFVQNRQEAIQKDIDKFERHVREVIKYFEEVKAMFTLAEELNFEEVAQIINGIETEMRGLIGEANQLLADYDELKELAKGYTDGLEFTATYTDIKKRIEELKDRLKEIKKDQISKYNTKIIATNDLIKKIKSGEGFEKAEGLTAEELAALNNELDGLYELDKCDIVITQWNQRDYLRVDYQKLKDVLLLIDKIKAKYGKGKISPVDPDPKDVDLESDMKYIEEKLVVIEGKITNGVSKDEIKPILDELTYVNGKITEFEVKLENNKDKITEEQYNEYQQRIKAARDKVDELRKRLVEEKTFDGLLVFAENLEKDVDSLEYYVNALFGKITQGALSVYEERLNTYGHTLSELRELVEKAKEEGKIDDLQYAKLNDKLKSIEEKLARIRQKTKDPKIVAAIENVDEFDFINKNIDDLEKDIDNLEAKIDAEKSPIKDKKTRREIDADFVKTEQGIKAVENIVEHYKDKDPQKYEAAKERLEELKGRLDDLGKKYRKKCPLIIRAVKSAKAFYKKHKKACLIVAGLAAIALVHATVGPVLIPAIMHGNIMIGATAPALSGFVGFVNNILGGMIGATKTAGVWTLANGAMINPAVASSSLLKGLAISGLGSAALLAPLTAGTVIAIKKLMPKMKKKTEEKERKTFKERFSSIKEKGRLTKEKVHELITKLKTKKGSINKDGLAGLKEVLKDYEKSGMTFEEYCNENELSESDQWTLKAYFAKIEEEKQKKEGRKGRR